MNMQEIPDIKYELIEGGNLLNLEQGHEDTTRIQLHKIHIKHLAEVMKVSADGDKNLPILTDYLERINEQATDLYELLSSIQNSHPQDQGSDDVIMARQLMDTAHKALCFWGAN